MGFGDMVKATQYMMKTKDLIVVTFNYRLGVHGFLCLGTKDVPGNAGMRWVKKNIASFGRNPDDVTLAGGSAGSASVDPVMFSKSAEGLFQRVVPESGGNLATFTIQRDSLEIAKKYARELLLKIKKYYVGDKPIGEDNILAYVNFFSEITFTISMLWGTKLHIEAGNNQIYLYEYTFVEEEDPVVPHTNVRGAYHGAQSMALMDGKNITNSDDIFATPKCLKMKNTVREIWRNFLKTGKPVPEGSSLLARPAAGADRSPHMALDEKLELLGVLLEERTRFWDDIYQKYYWDAVPPLTSPPETRAKL